MNAEISTLSPLPSALQTPFANPDRSARRRFVGDFPIENESLDRFNRLLAQLRHAPLDCDQLATASRELARQPARGRQPEAIEQRLRHATTIGLMVADPAWQPANEAVEPAHLVLDYVRSECDLIPDGVPLIGRLDDAIVIEAAWPLLAVEVTFYLDYYRVRAIEAELRGCEISAFAFGRDQWQQARRAELRWIAHTRRTGASSYLPRSAPACFRVS